MYRKSNLLWLFLCVVVGTFQACKKSDQKLNPTPGPQNSTTELLKEMKSWYNSQMLSGRETRAKTPDRIFEAPLWDFPENATEDGKTIRLPVKDYTLKNIGYSRYHFNKDKNGKIQGWVFEVLYKPSYWRKKVKEAQENGHLINPMKHDFTGAILQYDLHGNFITGRSYKDGKISTKIIPKVLARTEQLVVMSTAIDPEDDDEDSSIDEGDDKDEGGGWVIDLPGVDVSPEPSDPPPAGWEPSDPTADYPYPPSQPDDYVPGTDNYGGGDGTVTSTVTTTITYNDDVEPAGGPYSVEVGAQYKYLDGLITAVFGYWARPMQPISTYTSNGRTVTRKTAIMGLQGSHGPLPNSVTLVRWDYILNYTYSYVPYLPPITRQRSDYSIKYVYAH